MNEDRDGTIFRGLKPDFLNDLQDKSNSLNYVLEYEHKNRRKIKKRIILEIRDNFLNLYFLGHGIQVRRNRAGKYFLKGDKRFNPKSLLSERLKFIVKNDNSDKWLIYLEEIKTEDKFQEIIEAIKSKIVIHSMGSISEGVSEVNHIFDNRAPVHNRILIIDKQVAFPTTKEKKIGQTQVKKKVKKMDLLGIYKLEEGRYSFSVLELKNKNNTDINSVFSQLKNYIDIVHKNYESFVNTYTKVINQKIYLGLLSKIKFQFVPKKDISKKDIKGIVILDNFNVKSDRTQKRLLHRALKDWANQPDEYSFDLFLKTNVLDNTFFLDYTGAKNLLDKYRKNNAV